MRLLAAAVIVVAVAVAAVVVAVVVVVVALVAVAAAVVAPVGTGTAASSGFGTSWMLNSWPSCSKHREKEAGGDGDMLLGCLPATTKSVRVFGCCRRRGVARSTGDNGNDLANAS